MRARAFTLVELLVVIAIIGILLAVMAPTVGKMHERLNVDVCAGNLRQLGIAHLTFAANNDGRFCNRSRWVLSTSEWPHDWHDVARQLVVRGDLFPYVRRPETYLCPTFLQVYKPPACGCADTVPIFSYAMNYNLSTAAREDGWKEQGMEKVSQVSEPGNMLLLTEENTWLISGRASCGINNGLFVPPSDAMGSYHFPPSGQINLGMAHVLFVDGHVKLHHWTEGRTLCRQ